MRNASIDLKKSIDNGALFKTKATITFANGEAKELSEKDFYITGNSFSESTGTSSFPYGQNVAKSIRIRLVNNNEQFSDYDFANAKISLSVAWKNNDKEENILIGNYTVIEPEAYGDSISVSAVDDMYKGNATYETSLVFPQTLEYMLIDSCNSCGVSVDTSTLRNKDYLVYVKPDGITHRELWGYIAMLGGGNARFDENNVLKIVPYDLSFFSREGLDGGTFLTKDTLYSDGDNADGGNFNDYSSGDNYDGGTFEELNRYHTFYRGKTPTIATDDVIITGVKVTVNADEYISGNDGYVLSVNNPLVEGDELNGIQIIGENVIGMRFRPFSIDNTAYPIVEFGDICYVSDRKGNFYQSVVTDITFNFFGYTNVKCSADNPIRNSSSKVTATDSAVRVLRKETKEAIEQINDDIDDIGYALDDIDEDIEKLDARIDKTVSGIDIVVTNGKDEASINLTITKEDGSVVTTRAKTIKFTGDVIFASDLTDGTTEISGDNIKTGTISAERIDVDNLVAKKGNFNEFHVLAKEISISTLSGTGYIINCSGGTMQLKCVEYQYGSQKNYSCIDISPSGFDFTANGTDKHARINGNDIITSGNIGEQSVSYATNAWKLFSSNNAYSAWIKDDNKFSPGSNNSMQLGSSSFKWSEVFAGTGTINTSDRNYKRNIHPISDKYIDFFEFLAPVSFQFTDGKSGRTHIGFISQDVEWAMEQVGLTDLEFAGFCKDVKTEYYTDDDGQEQVRNVLDENGNLIWIYSLRYSEFIALNTAVLQRTRNELSELKNILKEKGVI